MRTLSGFCERWGHISVIIKCKAYDRKFNVNGTDVECDVPPLEFNDRTYLPIRFIAENMGLYVGYNVKNSVVTVANRKKYFDTADDCALNFGMYANCASIALYRETAAYLYKDENGYFWGDAHMGGKDNQNVTINAVCARKCVAILHTHGGSAGGAANNHFSTGDKKVGRKYEKPIYMCSPVGEQWRFDYDKGNGGKVTQIGYAPIDWKFENFCTSLGKRNYETAKNDFINYFKGKYKPITDEFENGYIFDYYNQMFLNNESY